MFVRCTYTEDVGKCRVERDATRIADAAKDAAPPTTQTGTRRGVKIRARLSANAVKKKLSSAIFAQSDLRTAALPHHRRKHAARRRRRRALRPDDAADGAAGGGDGGRGEPHRAPAGSVLRVPSPQDGFLRRARAVQGGGARGVPAPGGRRGRGERLEAGEGGEAGRRRRRGGGGEAEKGGCRGCGTRRGGCRAQSARAPGGARSRARQAEPRRGRLSEDHRARRIGG